MTGRHTANARARPVDPSTQHTHTHAHHKRTAWLVCLFGHTTRARYASTMSSCSHSVPLPLRSTSSGGIGMIVASEKMNGWMYVMYG